MLSQTTHLRRIFPLIFHTASTLSAPSGHLPLEGKAVCRGYRFPPPTSAPSGHLLPKEGGSIHASPFPWKGLLSAARRGWFPFLRRSRLLFTFPAWGRGTAQRRSGALVYCRLETIVSPSLSCRQCPIRPFGAPSPRGEGRVSRIPLSPSNLRPFGAPPSKGRREHPREPLPLEGAAERSEAGLASFFAAKPPPQP